MKNHFIGLLIFSFIISVSAFVAFWFAPLPQIAPVVSFDAPRYEGHGGCRRHRPREFSGDVATVKITQAVFDGQTGKLVTDFAVHRADSRMENVNIVLHFFVKDGLRTKYLTSQNIWIEPVFDEDGDGTLRYSLFNKLFNSAADYENLYVIPEIGYRNAAAKGGAPVFDAEKAVSVTNGKFSYDFAVE